MQYNARNPVDHFVHVWPAAGAAPFLHDVRGSIGLDG
jgi:hypothetical protein